MLNNKVIKVIGVSASIIGAVASLVGNWVSDKQMDAKVTEKVIEAVSKGNIK